MNTEQKAKAYDEALERARELRDKALAYNANHYVKDYETIFPELRESEDERIINAIIASINDNMSLVSMNGYTKKDMITYLEKQKEPKPAWSEEDDKMLARIIERGQSQIQMFETGLLPEHIAWLKSLRPQPHKEIYQAAKHGLAIKFMNYLDENRPDGKMCLSNAESEDIDKAFKENDWVKIMRYADKYQTHWKLGEGLVWRIWENGACGNSDGIPIALVKEGSTYRLVSCLGAGGEKYIMLSDLEKLPSLDKGEFETAKQESHWKPSEEQLNALNFAITYFMHETNYKNPTELRELYDDLLKLK